VRGVAQLNHYYTRSFEEFEGKRFRGSATGRISRPAVPFDVPTLETNTAAGRFSERTQATIERLRSLEPRPYTYGSELRLDWFPRPNDLGRFAEFAIANLAAGLAEPARSAALRLRNLHDDIGLVADLSGSGYQPRRDGFSGSVHGQVLIEHMRGRLESSLSRASADLPIAAVAGTLTLAGDGAAGLEPVAGSAEMLMHLPMSTTRRCWSLGFIVGAAAPTRMEVVVEGDDEDAGEPVRMELPASSCLAGIVEVEPAPRRATRLRIRVATEAARVSLYDLFAVSCG
jgi:hypothetical protein